MKKRYASLLMTGALFLSACGPKPAAPSSADTPAETTSAAPAAETTAGEASEGLYIPGAYEGSSEAPCP